MARLNFSRNVIGFCRQRAADRFRARQAFHNTNSVINAAAAETSRTGMRTLQLRVRRRAWRTRWQQGLHTLLLRGCRQKLRSRAAKMERMISEFLRRVK